MSRSAEILAKLKEGGHRMTTARKGLIEAFKVGCDPLSVQELHTRLKRDGIETNITTVYREAQFLAKQGCLRSVQFDDEVQRFELQQDGDHHHHLVCVKCKDVREIDIEEEVHVLETRIAKAEKFDIQRHSLEFYGLCNNCR